MRCDDLQLLQTLPFSSNEFAFQQQVRAGHFSTVFCAADHTQYVIYRTDIDVACSNVPYHVTYFFFSPNGFTYDRA